jgi:hypothetical protein
MRTNSIKPIPDTLSHAPKRPGLNLITLNTNLIRYDRRTTARYFLAGKHRHIMMLCQLDGLTPRGKISPATMPKTETTNRQVQSFGHDSPPLYPDIPGSSYNPGAGKTCSHPPCTTRLYENPS